MPSSAITTSILMVPGLEAIGIRVLLNECEPILRGNHAIHLAGIDDAHHYRLDDIPKAAAGIPQTAFSILLSHTPEVYREAASAGFDLLLGGHTHGGQICLPGAIPITLDLVLPRRMGSGAWAYARHDRVYIGRGRVLRRTGAVELPADDHLASPAPRLTRPWAAARPQ